VNDETASNRIAEAFRGYFSADRVRHTGPAPASEDFGCFGTAWHVPSVFWFVGGNDPKTYAEAKAAGKLNELPVNHSPQFAPVLHPTLETGVEALVVGALWVLVERTAIGQEIQAVGGNPAAARLAGISVDRIKILGFVISGMCAGLTGTLLASRLGSGTTSAADSYLLTAFAAVFLGSATLRDGEFHVLGTFIGTLIIVFGFNGLNIFGAPTFTTADGELFWGSEHLPDIRAMLATVAR